MRITQPLSPDDEQFIEKMAQAYCLIIGKDPFEVIPERWQDNVVTLDGRYVNIPFKIEAHTAWVDYVHEARRFYPFIKAYEEVKCA